MDSTTANIPPTSTALLLPTELMELLEKVRAIVFNAWKHLLSGVTQELADATQIIISNLLVPTLLITSLVSPAHALILPNAHQLNTTMAKIIATHVLM